MTINFTSASYFVTIENCRDDGINRAIRERVRQARHETLKGLSDSIFGVSSSYGFRSMFKSDIAVEAVQTVYDGIYFDRELPGLEPNTREKKNARFACVTEDSADKYRYLGLDYDPWQRCLVGGTPRRTPIPAFYAKGTAYIFLCPAYFVQEDQPTSRHCPTVHLNRFAGDPNIFYKNYQIYTLLLQLVRFYLGQYALDDHTDPPQQLDWNNCVYSLGTSNSARNPTNLQLYVACM